MIEDYCIFSVFIKTMDQLIVFLRHKLFIVLLSFIDDTVFTYYSYVHIHETYCSASRLNVGRSICVNEHKR